MYTRPKLQLELLFQQQSLKSVLKLSPTLRMWYMITIHAAYAYRIKTGPVDASKALVQHPQMQTW